MIGICLAMVNGAGFPLSDGSQPQTVSLKVLPIAF
jgi:hypothetical protein